MKSRLSYNNAGKYISRLIAATLLFLLTTAVCFAQSTSFTYQGRLTDGGTSANGNYDLQFALFDSLSGGSQIGSTQTLNTVAVSSGVFTVSLDFGGNAFPGASRFLAISARPSGAGSFTLLTPRQQITSTPYAVRSSSSANADTATNATNAAQLGGVAAIQFVQTNDSRLSDPRPPTPGSSNYIQNTGSPQAANFNISGNGLVGGNVGIGTTAPTAKLSIISTGGGARVLQLGTERAWVFRQLGTGAGTALELTGDDPANNNKNFVINTDGGVGIGTGTTTPQAKLDVRGNVKLGNGGQLFAPGGEENLRIIRGYVASDGTVLAGSGFTIEHTVEGVYFIRFPTPFSTFPVVVATPEDGGASIPVKIIETAPRGDGSGCRISMFNRSDGSYASWAFNFIAIGPR